MKRKDINIELVRIIACLIVICLHISQTYNINGNIDKSNLLIRSCLIDGVTLFWFIMGYFLFNDKSFKSILKKLIKKIIIPSTLIIIFTQIFYSWATNTLSFIECIKRFPINIKDIFLSFIFLDATNIEGIAHLWYIFEYIKIILWFPILNLFCNEKLESKKVRKYIIVIGILSILLNSIQIFISGQLKYTSFIISSAAIIQVLIGYELHNYENSLLNNRNKIIKIGLILTIMGFLTRFILQLVLFRLYNNMDYLMHTGRIINLISSIGIFITLKSILIRKKLENIIKFLASNTFYIYLIHFIIITKLECASIKEKILSCFLDNLTGKILFTIIYGIFVFIICLLISITIKFIITTLKKTLNKKRNQTA